MRVIVPHVIHQKTILGEKNTHANRLLLYPRRHGLEKVALELVAVDDDRGVADGGESDG